jgi:solute carrier family 15 (oligopeptide transporter), member 1
VLLNVLVLYLPLPFFWTLFDQQGSRWTFQATRMTGDLGFYTLKPDQMQVINPLLILVFIPLYEVIFYPLLNLIGIRRPLQKLTLGGIFAGFAFLASMFVEIAVEPTYAKLPTSGEAQIRIYNGLNCNYIVSSSVWEQNQDLPQNSYNEKINMPIIGDNQTLKFNFKQTSNSNGCIDINDKSFVFSENKATSLFIKGTPNAPIVEMFEDDPDKSDKGNAIVRILSNLPANPPIFIDGENSTSINTRLEVSTGNYNFKIGNKDKENKGFPIGKDLLTGGVYVLIVQGSTSSPSSELLQITDENSVSMLWLIPQYVIMVSLRIIIRYSAINTFTNCRHLVRLCTQ